ncbi:unnamed protein product [Diatraea saccharalis]|uniref:AMP-dependent synthetase/ligase domain-containing protein n=1 Tax=Diatraea saccharalis TaxID=40085 RepID=A0A9P0G0A5_9NEOP|nr:unnamed protein product [Diatraea saccharalis]
MKAAGLKVGDVVILMAPNHIDLVIPYYAALYLGVIVAAVDRTLDAQYLRNSFNINRPRMVFCQNEKVSDIQRALDGLELDTLIVTFDKGDLCSFNKFLERGMNGPSVDEFRPTDFNPEDTIGLLIATSGTTGLPKSVAVTHKSLAISGPYIWSRFHNFPTPTEIALVGSPLHWLTALINFYLSTIFRYTRLQSSMDLTQKHAYHLINTYRPTFTIFSPTAMTTLLKSDDRDQCDFTCFDIIMLGGSAVPRDLIGEIKVKHTKEISIETIHCIIS